MTGATGAILGIKLLMTLGKLNVETHLLHFYAHHVYDIDRTEAPIAGGSFRVDGMIVRRRLVLVTRETPLSKIHLRNMLGVTRAGAVAFPPVPAFYTWGDFGGQCGE
ncbi:Flavin prenyltransferase PAD1 [Trichoderma ghanense]|uniref:Flavin prenyltransferase PAD1 n=1 Tax=Trichoderma ghanense TaxID=65468 RepID=A0ABY2H1S0_9HYPO